MPYDYDRTSVVNGNMHILTLVDPVVETDTQENNENDVVSDTPVVSDNPHVITLTTPLVDGINIVQEPQIINAPYDYDNTTVVNQNVHTLTLATPIVRDGSGGPMSYEALYDKPRLNNVELIGNISLMSIGAQPAGNYPSTPLTVEDLEYIIRNEL